MTNFCISLTTIPPRAKSINKTLRSLNQQSVKANKIFLNLPKNFRRFNTNIKIDIKSLEKEFKNLEVVDCDDYGSGTKLLGSLKKIQNYDYVILVDDDHIYKKYMLEFFKNRFLNNSDKSYSFHVYNVLDCKVGQGADGFLIRSKYLKNIYNFYENHVKNDERLILNDDLWISIYLNKVLKIDIESIFSMIRQPIFFKIKSIYKKHTQLGAIIETYSQDRKQARKLKHEENCQTYKELKSRTKNFTIL